MIKKPTTELVSTSQSFKAQIAGEAGLAKIKSVLAAGVDPKRFVQVALMALNRPELADCSPISALQCVIDAASLGLDFAPVLGEAYPVPFSRHVGLIVGYQGLQKLAREAEGIEIDADCVFRGDSFKVRRGTDPGIVHEYGPSDRLDDAEITHAYAVAYDKAGKVIKTLTMTRSQIEAVRKRSKMPDGMLWKNTKDGGSYHEGARKTVVRRLSKYLPKSPASRFTAALENEDRWEDIATEAVDDTNRAADLAATLKAKRALPPADQPATESDLRLAEAIEAKRVAAAKQQAAHTFAEDPIEESEPEAPGNPPSDDATPPDDPGLARYDQMIRHIANAARCDMEDADRQAVAFLGKYKYEPHMLADDGRWAIVWNGVKKRDWSMA